MDATTTHPHGGTPMSHPLTVDSGDSDGPVRVVITPPEPGGTRCVLDAYTGSGDSWTLRCSADVPIADLAAWVWSAAPSTRPEWAVSWTLDGPSRERRTLRFRTEAQAREKADRVHASRVQARERARPRDRDGIVDDAIVLRRMVTEWESAEPGRTAPDIDRTITVESWIGSRRPTQDGTR